MIASRLRGMGAVGVSAAFVLAAATLVAGEPRHDSGPPSSDGGLVTVWRDGEAVGTDRAETARQRGLFVVDLGDDWVPVLFEGSDYEPRFRALANELPIDGLEGVRAERDRYLEVYGIPPSLGVLRERFYEARRSRCRRRISLAPLRAFKGAPIDADTAREAIEKYERLPGFRAAVAAAQERLACDGHFDGPVTGRYDDRTRAALAEFERRHRIYARARLDGPTLDALTSPALELERRALVRVITERVLLAEGIIEDRSVYELEAPDGTGRATAGLDGPAGSSERAPDLVGAVTHDVERAFGLETVAGASRFFEALGEPDGHRLVALPGAARPHYHGDAMDLYVEIDRGDIWYDPPIDASGGPIEQPVERGPTLTLFVREGGRALPLVRYRTTVGGWRVLVERGREALRYMESPVGRRVWSEIVAAPVWLPPPAYPDDSLVTALGKDERGQASPQLDRNLVGPSYASAYGLVAAYHNRFARAPTGKLVVLGDEGIRTHGSSDYTSPWNSVSLGCHRLRNHLALRLFTFLLHHRRHRRVGHREIGYVREIEAAGVHEELRIERSGYVFALDPPVEVNVLRGRVLGRAKRASRRAIHVPPPHDTAADDRAPPAPTP